MFNAPSTLLGVFDPSTVLRVFDDSFSILGLGFVLGLKHALDADHLIAVSTIVGEKKGFWRSSVIGAFWGLGHTASLLAVGLLVIAFHLQIPEKVALGMEFAVALMLIALGANVLWAYARGATFHLHTHQHSGRLHVHPHFHKTSEHPADKHIAHHHSVSVGKKPFFVGMVHGMAGSAALMLLVLASISSRTLGLLYIGIFGVGSIGGMFLMSALIGLPFSLAGQAFTAKYERLNAVVRTTAGAISVGFGLFLAYEIGIVEGLFL